MLISCEQETQETPSYININEYSLRYSEARDEFYLPDPDHIQFQSALNKQGRMGTVSKELKDKVDTSLARLLKNGTILKLHQKWELGEFAVVPTSS